MPLFEGTQVHHAERAFGADQDLSIEALRGLAAILVLISHYVVLVRDGAGIWGMAATGVDLFFVLSCFVFARSLGQTGWAVAPYLLRRFFRLYPLYLLALLAYALLKPEEQRWAAWWPHLFMLHTTGDLALASHYNVAFWSLPPEVEFYLVLPLLAGALAAFHRKRAAGLWCLLGLALLMKLGLVAQAYPGEPLDSFRTVLTVHLPGLLVEFLIGSAVAVAVGQVHSPHLGKAWPARQRSTGAVCGLSMVLILAVVYEQQLSTPEAAAQAPLWLAGNFGLLVAVAFALLLLGRGRGLGLPSRASTAPPKPSLLPHLALWAGRLSYGVYLLHNAAPALLQRLWPEISGWPLVLSSVLLTLVAAWALHVWVEAPCRAYGRSWASRWRAGA